MARLLRMRRRAVDQVPEYLSAWDIFRRSVEGAGWHAWLFRGARGIWLEFVEGNGTDRTTLEGSASPAIATAEAGVARCGTLVEESWWDEVPPGGDNVVDATGG